MNRIQTLGSEVKAQEVSAVLERDGCVIVRNLIEPRAITTLRAELAPYLEEQPPSPIYGGAAQGKGISDSAEFLGFKTTRTSALMAKSRTARTLAVLPLVLGVCDQLLLPNCGNYQLNATQAIRIGPTEKPQVLHRDDGIYPTPHPHPHFILAVMWAVDDFGEENGGTRVVTGSHRWLDDREPGQAEAISAVMPSGSALFYLGETFHGGGANRTQHPRLGVVLEYSLGWLRQEENQYLVTPPSIARELPEQLQNLIGYEMHRPFLGWVELDHPRVMLQQETGPWMPRK